MASEIERMLLRLTEKVERANNIQHSGGSVLPEDWAELYQLTIEARAMLHKLNSCQSTEERSNAKRPDIS